MNKGWNKGGNCVVLADWCFRPKGDEGLQLSQNRELKSSKSCQKSKLSQIILN